MGRGKGGECITIGQDRVGQLRVVASRRVLFLIVDAWSNTGRVGDHLLRHRGRRLGRGGLLGCVHL